MITQESDSKMDDDPEGQGRSVKIPGDVTLSAAGLLIKQPAGAYRSPGMYNLGVKSALFLELVFPSCLKLCSGIALVRVKQKLAVIQV